MRPNEALLGFFTKKGHPARVAFGPIGGNAFLSLVPGRAWLFRGVGRR